MPNEDRTFTAATAGQLRDAAASRCSNPTCRRVTRLFVSSGNSVITGEAAHIYAAGRGRKAPRPNADMDDEEVRSTSNGIWLCRECHKLIDRAPGHFTADTLLRWKTWAESDYTYDFVRPVGSLPAHCVVADTDTGKPAIGLHVMVAGSTLRAVCTKLTLEVITEVAHGEFRARRRYETLRIEGKGFLPVPAEDWHSFPLSEGYDDYLYFSPSDLDWLPSANRNFSPVMFRLNVYAALEKGGVEVLSSPWDVGVLTYDESRLPRIELDEHGALGDMLAFSNGGPLQRLLDAERNRNWVDTIIAKTMRFMQWDTGDTLFSMYTNRPNGRLSFDIGCSHREFDRNEQSPLDTVECLWADGVGIRIRHTLFDLDDKAKVAETADYAFLTSSLHSLGLTGLKQVAAPDRPPFRFRPKPAY